MRRLFLAIAVTLIAVSSAGTLVRAATTPDAPVLLKVYVDQKSRQLRAVDVWPLRDQKPDGEPDRQRGERILLLDPAERDGLLVPRELVYLFRNQQGQLYLHSRVKLATLDLRPRLDAADFDRK